MEWLDILECGGVEGLDIPECGVVDGWLMWRLTIEDLSP